jgi:phenylacetate-CoA ligase
MSRNAALSANIYDFLIVSQHWRPSQLVDYQHGQLEQLIQHARANVPFYRERLDPLFNRSGTIDWTRWTSLPIVTRKDLAEHGTTMLADRIPESHGTTKTFTTSGTTGLPVSVTHTGLSSAVWQAAAWRSHRWYGLDWAAGLVHWPHIGPDEEGQDPARNFGSWGYPGDAATSQGSQYVMSRTYSVAERLDHLLSKHISYVYTPSNILFAAALEAKRLGLKASFAAAISSTMAVEHEHAEACREVFDAAVHGTYSSKEAGRIGHSCGTTGNIHIAAEYELVEIVDDDGKPCPPGVPGRVIVTPFLNTAQPLIRYEQGDIAVAGPACPCGSGLPVLSTIQGRIYHMFRLADGRLIAPTIPDRLRTIINAVTIQFAQVATDEIEVRYIPGAAPDPEAENRMAEEVRQHLGVDMRLRFKHIAEIPLTASGKFIKYVCELPRNPPT